MIVVCSLGSSLDNAGDTARATERHEDDVVVRDGNSGRRARAFRPDRILDHLDDAVGVGGEELESVLGPMRCFCSAGSLSRMN